MPLLSGVSTIVSEEGKLLGEYAVCAVAESGKL
jgi:hypothetical protein